MACGSGSARRAVADSRAIPFCLRNVCSHHRSLQNQMLTLTQPHEFQGHLRVWDKAVQSGMLTLVVLWNEALGTKAGGSSHHGLYDSYDGMSYTFLYIFLFFKVYYSAALRTFTVL